jgi:hypothetical protein
MKQSCESSATTTVSPCPSRSASASNQEPSAPSSADNTTRLSSANDAVIDAIAEALKIKKRDIIILHGHTGRDKLIEIIDDTKKPQIDALLNIQ